MDEGGRIVFIGKTPFKSASFHEIESSDAEIIEMTEEIMNRKDGHAILYPSPSDDLISWYGKLQDKLGIQPYIRFSKPSKHVQSVFL